MLSATAGRFEFCQRTHTDIWPLRTSSPSANKGDAKGVAAPWDSDEWRKMKKLPEVDGIKRWMQSNPELVRQMEKRRRQSAQAAAPVAPSSSRSHRSPARSRTSPRRTARRQTSLAVRGGVTVKPIDSQLSRLIDAQHGYRDRVTPRSGHLPPVAPSSHRGFPYRETGLSVPDPFRPRTMGGRPYDAF